MAHCDHFLIRKSINNAQKCLKMPRNASNFLTKVMIPFLGKRFLADLWVILEAKMVVLADFRILKCFKNALKWLKMPENATKIIAKVRRSLFMIGRFWWYLAIFNDF
jgi:hypothetical protein